MAQMRLVKDAAVSGYCQEYWRLFHEWSRENAKRMRKQPNQAELLFGLRSSHLQTCVVCRANVDKYHQIAKSAYMGDSIDEQEYVPTPK